MFLSLPRVDLNGLVSRAARCALLVASCVLLLSSLMFGQNSSTSDNMNSQTTLLERIASLEAIQRQLLERMESLEKAQCTAPTASLESLSMSAKPAELIASEPQTNAAPKVATPPASSAAVPSQQPDVMEPEHMDVSKTLLNIRGFGDFGLYGGNQKGQTTSFSIGELNLFITSNLSEHLRFLTELVFEVQQNNDFEEDLERVLLEYSMNDYFKLSAGRYHTAIGYYNTAYHHATWFQTSTERPYIFQYEDEGGILPIHNVGIEASGMIPSGKLGLHYVAEVANGRTSSSPLAEPVQNYVDENTHKAVNLAIFARPDAVPGLQVGFSAYRDALFPQVFPVNSTRINETILDGYAVLSRPRFEWLNEALMIRHAPVGQHVFETPAFYSQISERFGQYRPYFRYEYVNASSHEPVFPQVGLRTGPSVGVRYDPTSSLALKLQYEFTELRRQAPIDGKTCPQLTMCAPNALGLQVDFKF